MSLPKPRPYKMRLGPLYHNETLTEYRVRMFKHALEAILIDIVCDRPGGLNRADCDQLLGLLVPAIKKFIESKQIIS